MSALKKVEKVLITGGTGFIGRHVVEALSSEYELVLPVRDRSKSDKDKRFSYVGPLNGNTCWSESLKGVNCVVHGAALVHAKFSDQELVKVNVEGSVKLAKDAVEAGVSRFIFISSIGVNGGFTEGYAFTENNEPDPITDYAKSKLAAESELIELSQKSGMALIIVRPPLVYGHGAPGKLGRLFRLVSKLPFNPFIAIKNNRSYVSVKNLADFIGVCVRAPKGVGGIYLIEDLTVSTSEFFKLIAKSQNKKVYSLYIPKLFFDMLAKLPFLHGILVQLTGNLQVDASKAKRDLDWSPKFTVESSMKE